MSLLNRHNYSHIHIDLNYANLSLDSTNRINLKKLLSPQKSTQYELLTTEHALTIPTIVSQFSCTWLEIRLHL